MQNSDDTNRESGPDQSIADTARLDRQRDIIEESTRKNLSIAEQQTKISKYNLISSTSIGSALVLLTVVLVYFTKQLSDETDALKVASLSQVRSYLSVQSIVSNFIENDKTFRADVVVKADGYTPAFDVFMDQEAVLSPVVDNTFSNYGRLDPTCTPPKENSFGYGDIAVGESRHYNIFGIYTNNTEGQKEEKTEFTDLPSADQINDFKKGKTILVVKGRICFKDIFGEIRYTRFCRGYNYENMAIGKEASYELCAVNDSR